MADEIEETSHISTGNFKWGEVVPPGVRARRAAARPAAETSAEPPLGPLANFAPAGENVADDAQRIFKGNGFNTIFRPQNFALTPSDLGGEAKQGNNDNVLELNLTRERLTFSKSLGSVPNRGAKNLSPDIFLNGVPYIQRIDDITFGVDNAVGIHFEPGAWLAVPATDKPQEVDSFVRMASIPHGTTINAQGIAFGTIAGPPPIAAIDMTPFILANGNRIKFPSQTVANQDTFRIPQNLDGIAITQSMLDDPNSVLRDRLNEQTITSTDTLFVATNPPPRNPPFPPLPPTAPDIGGGTDNIAFLQGDNDATNNHPGANAEAASLSSIFWIETVQEEIKIPVCKQGDDFEVQGGGPGELSVTYSGNAPCDIDAECPITVSYTQIQYSQLVVLNFSGLGWPHVSVATLVPAEKIVLDRDAIEAAAKASVPAAAARGAGSGT